MKRIYTGKVGVTSLGAQAIATYEPAARKPQPMIVPKLSTVAEEQAVIWIPSQAQGMIVRKADADALHEACTRDYGSENPQGAPPGLDQLYALMMKGGYVIAPKDAPEPPTWRDQQIKMVREGGLFGLDKISSFGFPEIEAALLAKLAPSPEGVLATVREVTKTPAAPPRSKRRRFVRGRAR